MIARLMLLNFLAKTQNIHRQIVAESLENDTNHENNKISRLKLYQYAEGISVSNSKTVERAGRTNRDMKTATTEAKRRSKLQLENGKLTLCLKVNIRFPFIFKLLIILVCISVKWISIIICIIRLYSTSNRVKCA